MKSASTPRIPTSPRPSPSSSSQWNGVVPEYKGGARSPSVVPPRSTRYRVLRETFGMAFLEELDSLPADQPQARMGLFLGHLRADWRGLFAELREKRPVLDLPLFLVVSRWTDVMDALSRPSDFQVTYGPHMDPSVGPFMLGRDDSELNWHDKSLMRTLMRWDDLPAIRTLVGRLAAEALASNGETIDLVASVSRLIPLRVVQ